MGKVIRLTQEATCLLDEFREKLKKETILTCITPDNALIQIALQIVIKNWDRLKKEETK